MRCLVVKAHPLDDSLCAGMAQRAAATLDAAGHEMAVEDLYAQGFEPALTAEERASYYAGPYAAEAVSGQVERLLAAEGIVLVFPTWWFGPPAILKGWFDRVWAPGIAYDHAADLGAIRPRLHGLRRMLAVTTLGAPWWVDRLVLRQPVKRILKTALVGTCAPRCRFRMLSQYRAERLTLARVEAFGRRVRSALSGWS